ncbi:myrosinase 1-like [Epargyreus clarus]|uniref:myrosinase 1-like n=1 Tax=Epargyreus clarus TaxID=520877 RepID=UPI003C2C9088
MCYKVVLFSGLLCVVSAVDRKFPPYFLFGSATASYQVEGAWNTSGKGESLWDRYVHENQELVADKSTGDVATDSYHKWEADVAACAELGLHYYRFSISWPRVLPSGFTNKINKDGVRYYNNLINGLLKNNIQPMVTLYHWDMPQRLQDLGGWTNPLMADWFAAYAEVMFSLFGDRVKYWITINEPAVICDFSYSGVLAPGIEELILAPYLCNKNILLAHAKAWRIYDEKFKHLYHGRVSVANHLVWFEPAYENATQLTELAQEYLTGRYSHPIYSQEGGWPPIVEKHMAKLSKRQGYNQSRLPSFTEEEKLLIKGTYDYYGMNHYTTRLVKEALPGEDTGIWFLSGSSELNIIIEFDPSWEKGFSNNFAVYPPGLRKQLAWLKQRYGDIDVIITENGFSNGGSLINDHRRIQFIHDYLEQVLLSIKVDGVNVIAYTYWSLIDNFEWMDGYSTKFGLYEIDFNDVNLPRIPRRSAEYYSSIIKTQTLPDTQIYSAKMQSSGRYRRKEPAQNGGQRVTQNGRLIISIVILSLTVLLL